MDATGYLRCPDPEGWSEASCAAASMDAKAWLPCRSYADEYCLKKPEVVARSRGPRCIYDEGGLSAAVETHAAVFWMISLLEFRAFSGLCCCAI
jgi:hypothetical protein